MMKYFIGVQFVTHCATIYARNISQSIGIYVSICYAHVPLHSLWGGGVDMQSLAHHVVRNVFGTMYMGYQLLHARFSVFMMCNSTFQMHISPCTHAQYL